MADNFEPKIVGFLCRWCSYAGADLAGTSRMKYPPNMIPIRVNCSGRIDPTFVMKALSEGADGVLLAGCHFGDCHYIEGNYKAMRRFLLLKRALDELGLDPERVRLEWVSAGEGERFAQVVTEMVEEVRALGPLNWAGGHKVPAPLELPEELRMVEDDAAKTHIEHREEVAV